MESYRLWMDKNMIIYHAYHKEKPVFYIGKTIFSLEHRKKQHENESRYLRTNSYFHKALRKYGFDSFEWRILEVCDTLDKLNEAEIKWIKLVKECGHRLYNLVEGGTGGDCGGSIYWKTHSPSPEMRGKISEGLKRYYSENESNRKGTHHVGHPHSDDTKLILSIRKMGHEVTEETRSKLRSANIGKKLKPHVIKILKDKFSGKNNPSAKPIICTTTGEHFEYAKQASIKYGIDLSSIIKCCRGKLKTCKGMKFEYSPTGYPAGWKIL